MLNDLRVNVPSLPGIKEQKKHENRKRFFDAVL